MATSMAAATIGHVKLLRPLRERDFALLWTGMTVSLLGDGIFIVAEAWQVYDIDNDPVALSLVGLAWTGGMTAFLLTGGIVSDRVERRRVLIAADLVRALVAGRHRRAVAGRRARDLAPRRARRCSMGVGEAFFGPAFGALVPEIVAPPRTSSRPTRSSSSCARPASGCSGPAVGGLVVAARRRRAARSSSTRAPSPSARRASAALRVRSLPAAGRRALGAPRAAARRVAFVRSQPWLWATLVAAVAEPAALPRPARGPAALRRAQRPRTPAPGGYGAILVGGRRRRRARVAGRQPARRRRGAT